jgi:hypothetical protein
MRMMGPGELRLDQLKDLVQVLYLYRLSPSNIDSSARSGKNTQEIYMTHLMPS